MPSAYVGNGTNSANSNVITYSMASANDLAVFVVGTSSGGGNPFLTAAVTNNGGQLVPIFGSYNNTTNKVAVSANPFTFMSYWYYVPGTDASAPTSFTLTFNGGTPGNCDIGLIEYSGISTSPLIATVGTINQQTNPGTGANLVVSNAQTVNTFPALILGISIDNSGPAFSAGTGFTQRANASLGGGVGVSFEDQRATASGSYQPAWTSTHGAASTFASMVLAFAEPSGVPPSYYLSNDNYF